MKIFVAFPQQVLFLFGQFVIGPVDRKVEFGRVLDQLFFPPFHRFAAPAGNGAIINAFGFIRYHEVFVDAGHFAVTLASRAGPHRIVETEHMFRRMLEADAVELEA